MEQVVVRKPGKNKAGLEKRILENKLPWISKAQDAPYFIDDIGNNWTPIGQNDAITWPELQDLFRRKDVASVERYLIYLKEHGVTCLRLMLEYCQTQNRYVERPVGHFQPNMVKLWDDLFSLCEKHELRILLTPFDTFWMWIRWKKHPYNRSNGGTCARRSHWLLCPDTLAAIKGRLTFVTHRWGGSGVLFAWDLWNEIHPAHAGNNTEVFYQFIEELSNHLREVEMKLYGRTHLQTVSLFGPVLQEHPAVADVIFRHQALDFATTHFYDAATINYPKDTVASAICTGALVREALGHLPSDRPFFDSEHGPIHNFKDRKRTLPEPFDDEYFRHIQWAHLASGAAGGGMRWPNRHPHVLTKGMREAQHNLSQFVQLIEWKTFYRRNLNDEILISTPAFKLFACGDQKQTVVWLLRRDRLDKKGMIPDTAEAEPVTISIPNLEEGQYQVIFWDTRNGESCRTIVAKNNGDNLIVNVPPVVKDIALVVRKFDEGNT